ncbi:MAG: hypothetical protein ABSC05_31305 [Candidatus Solibacter sp.]
MTDINSLLGGEVEFRVADLDTEMDREDLDWLRRHFKITPKPNPPGRPLDPLINKGVELAKQQGMTNAQICRELKIPKKEQHTFKSSMRTRLGTLQPDEQAAIREARLLHKVPARRRGNLANCKSAKNSQ